MWKSAVFLLGTQNSDNQAYGISYPWIRGLEDSSFNETDQLRRKDIWSSPIKWLGSYAIIPHKFSFLGFTVDRQESPRICWS